LSPQILEEAFHRVDFDRELVFKFFIVFSLFEYALKEARLRRSGSNAEPDWDAFTDSIEQSFGPNKSNELNTAVAYIFSDPPKQQVNMNGQMNFEPRDPVNGNSEVRKLSVYIRRIRNNLFHGGKFQYDRPRDTFLIKYSLIILEEWAGLNPDVQRILHNVK
jgi:hypothetical protein